MIGMTIYTPAEEVFVSLNETDSSSPYDYVIRRYISGDATLQGAQRDLLSQFGDAFDPQKNYYRVDLYATYESDGD